MLKAAIIGAGFISEFHADAYQALQQVQVCAICDTNYEKANALAKKLNCIAYTDAEQMLTQTKPDLVSICVPSFLHEPFTLLALEHGAHVLCEKPLSLTIDSCERMKQAAQQAGRILMTGQVLRFWPEYQIIAGHIQRMGSPCSIATQRLKFSGRTNWMPDPLKGGGVLFDLLVHDLDYLCSLFGFDPQIDAVYGTKGKENSWRSLCVILRWKNGTSAKIEASNLMPPKFPFTANLRADYPDRCVSYQFRAPVNIQKDAKTQTEFLLFEHGEVIPQPCIANAQSVAFQNEIEAFVLGAVNGVNPIPIDQPLQIMQIIHQIKENLENQPVFTEASAQ